jgi:hypothetical protein
MKEFIDTINCIKFDETSYKTNEKFEYAVKTLNIVYEEYSSKAKIIIDKRNEYSVDIFNFLFDEMKEKGLDRKKTINRLLDYCHKILCKKHNGE